MPRTTDESSNATPVTGQAIEPAVRELIELFRDRLGDVTFPDVSAATLTAEADDVHERAVAVAQARAALDAARNALESSQARLRRHAERGLAYARVYAEGDHELSEQLASISLAPPARTPRARRRRRKPKRDAVPQLPLDRTPDDTAREASG